MDTYNSADLKESVLSFLRALNAEDFSTARAHLTDDMTFEGVLGSREGADAYIADMSRMKFKYDVIRAFAEDNDVCLLYDIDMGNGLVVFTCGWYRLENGKIRSLKVVFDPRPVLAT